MGPPAIVSRNILAALNAKVSQHFWRFYGDERLNEVITVYDEAAWIVRSAVDPGKAPSAVFPWPAAG